MTEVISVYDDGVRLDIPFEACVLYHGRDSIGGLSLGYRLLCFALNKLTEGRIPERKEISFKTAFPGPGLRDAVEMTTRAVTRKAYEVLENAPEGTPEGVYGHMYFEVTVWALRRFAVPSNLVYFLKSLYGLGEPSRKVITPSKMRDTGESKRMPSPRRYGVFLILRTFCLFR